MADSSNGEKACCAVCKKGQDAGDVSLKRCARCGSVSYCSRECQAQDWPTHKTSCKRPNYVLTVDLCPEYINAPRVRRTLSCPATATFLQLHHALQIAFGWA